MKPKITYGLIPGFILLALTFPVRPGTAMSPQRVFILHSYEQNHVCGQPQQDGVMTALGNAGYVCGKNIRLQTYFMDTKRNNNTPELIRQQARRALQKIDAFKPEVLVVLDDNAFRSVALPLAGSDLPIVFCGMNEQPEIYNHRRTFMNSRKFPGHNITGVYEKLHIADAIRVHSRMFAGSGKVLILTDRSPTGNAIFRQIQLELLADNVAIPWEIKVAGNWAEYKALIVSAASNPEISVIYPAALLLKDAAGATYTAPQIFTWTIQNSNKPEIAINYSFTRLGLFGGAAVDFHAMGEQAGRMTARILSGEAAGDIPIENADRYALAFNLRRAAQLGITIPDDILLAADEVVR